MTLDLRALDPVPTAVVANLPYGIAAGAILRTIEELDGVTRWVAMVQREGGERFAAAPGSSAYGGPRGLAQLAGDVELPQPRARRQPGQPPHARDHQIGADPFRPHLGQIETAGNPLQLVGSDQRYLARIADRRAPRISGDA